MIRDSGLTLFGCPVLVADGAERDATFVSLRRYHMTGLLTLSLWRAYAERGDRIAVLVDGEDVTTRCAASDDRHDEGRKHIVMPPCGHRQRQTNCVCDTWPMRPAMELVVGRVEHAVLEPV